MISALHALIYSDDAPATRAFFSDVLGLPHVTDGESSEPGVEPGSPGSWLIFRTGASELGVHPTRGEHDGEQWQAPRHHQISLCVDDIQATAVTLRERGADVGDPVDLGFGIGLEVPVPGTDAILVYQPRHVTTF